MPRLLRIALASLLAAGCAPRGRSDSPGQNGEEAEDDGWPDAFEAREGLFTLHVDREGGRLWLELPAAGEGDVLARCLYLTGLTSGLGSSELGFDRGAHGENKLVRFRRLGETVVLEEENLAYRAAGHDGAERQAVETSFPTSVIWAGPVEHELEDGSVVVDITGLAVGDALDMAERMKPDEDAGDEGHGSLELDPERSALDPASVRAFPDNVVFEGLVTLAVTDASRTLARNLPDDGALSVVVHHSLIRLPDDGYAPRPWHPASGAMHTSFLNFSAPLDGELETRWVVRHRLEKGEPLVYHVDRGVPEPIRSALIDGASWWAEAFEAAGYPGGFEVRLLPEDADPLDVRYNVIQWVHRRSRGWSYGRPIHDPRTGEIIKGHVTLGSQRIRQDILIFESLGGAARTGTGAPDDPVELALARIRQLAAHEVGHTLGIQHNFAASSYGRASVMDYPAPRIRVEDGALDFSDAYAVGMGAWDRQVVRYMYADFPPGEEVAGLGKILDESHTRGWIFLADEDGRSVAGAHPRTSIWDDGEDAIAGLENALEVRRVALGRFGAGQLREGLDWPELERRLAIAYFHHRYQLEAALKWIGGIWYDHDRRRADDPVQLVKPEDQERALEVVLSVLDPAVLDIPETILAKLQPHGRGETFASDTYPAFDSLGAAATATRALVQGLLEPSRMARLVDLHHRDPGQPGLERVLERLVGAAFPARTEREVRHAELRRTIEATVVDEMIALAARGKLPARVRARLDAQLEALARTTLRGGGDAATRSHRRALARRVTRHLERPHPAAPLERTPAPAPPGGPIGMPPPEVGCSLDW